MPPKKSNKRSATNASRRERYAAKAALERRPVLFIDRAIQGRLLIDALREKGANIQLHQDHFSDNSPDTEWLPQVGKWGWCVLTRDKAIKRNPLERRAMENAGVGYFSLAAREVTGEEIATIVAKALPRIEAVALKANKPFIALIGRNSIVKLVSEAASIEDETSIE